MPSSVWRPIFEGESSRPYRNAIEHILRDLQQRPPIQGDWGAALLHAYIAKVLSSKSHRDRAEMLVNGAVEWLLTVGPRPQLYSGIAGAGWLSAHIAVVLSAVDGDDYDEVDGALLRFCHSMPDLYPYDLISGAVGLGVYFVERLPAPAATAALRAIIERLQSSADEVNGRWTWATPSALLPPWQQSVAPHGYHNLGVAHGVPGIIGLLAEIRQAGLEIDGLDPMLRGAIRWVLEQRLEGSLLPGWVLPDMKPVKSRVAWCYGELGAAVTLTSAARALSDATIERHAIEMAMASAKRRSDNGVIDASLCHGAAGNGHLFNRLYQSTGHYAFRVAAQGWFEQALEMRRDGSGIAGFQTWHQTVPGNERSGEWRDDVSFLTGATGIALAFLAAISSVSPDWDRVLLSNLPPVS